MMSPLAAHGPSPGVRGTSTSAQSPAPPQSLWRQEPPTQRERTERRRLRRLVEGQSTREATLQPGAALTEPRISPMERRGALPST